MSIINGGCPSDTTGLFDRLEEFPIPLASSILIGYLLNVGLQGILTSQIYTYYLAFPNDNWVMKTLAYGIFVIEFLQTCLGVHDVLASYLPIFEPRNHMPGIQALNNMHLLWLTVPILGGFVGFTEQCFFAYRLYLISRGYILPCVIVLFSTCSTSAAIVLGAQMLKVKNLICMLTERNIQIVCGLWNGFSATCDLIIVLCMIYQLLNSETGFHKTHILLNKLIRITIETGFITAAAAVTNTVLYVGFRSRPDISSYFAIPAMSIGKLYAITLLVIINSRLNVVGGRYSQTDPISTILDGGVQRMNWSKSGHELESGTEIRVERYLIQQTWTDDSRWGFTSTKRHNKKNSELLPESQILAAHRSTQSLTTI